MEQAPILTVVVPSYNVEAYLDRTLTSLCQEDFNDRLEVLVVNDGSKDRTQEIAERYAVRWPRILRVINKENGGHGSGVNVGMRQGRGTYFRIIDGDDWVNTDEFRALLAALTPAEEDVVITELTEVDMTTEAAKRISFPDSLYTKEVYWMEELVQRPEYDACFRLHSMNVRMDLIRQYAVELPEHCFYVDYLFLLLTTSRAKSVRVRKDNVYQYLVGNANQSVSYQNYVNRYEQHDRVLKGCVSFCNNFHGTPIMEEYVVRKTAAIIHTQMNISLLFDEDRARGRKRTEELRAYLSKEAPKLAQLTESRYKKTLWLHRLGIGAKGFERINRMRGL